jgi:hypothetical protein
MESVSTTNKPMCNARSNDVQYYSPNALSQAGGALGVFFNSVSLVVFVLIFGLAYASRGFDVLTIVLLVLVISSVGALIYNYIKMTSKPEGYTEDCVQNPNFKK